MGKYDFTGLWNNFGKGITIIIILFALFVMQYSIYGTTTEGAKTNSTLSDFATIMAIISAIGVAILVYFIPKWFNCKRNLKVISVIWGAIIIYGFAFYGSIEATKQNNGSLNAFSSSISSISMGIIFILILGSGILFCMNTNGRIDEGVVWRGLKFLLVIGILIMLQYAMYGTTTDAALNNPDLKKVSLAMAILSCAALSILFYIYSTNYEYKWQTLMVLLIVAIGLYGGAFYGSTEATKQGNTSLQTFSSSVSNFAMGMILAIAGGNGIFYGFK